MRIFRQQRRRALRTVILTVAIMLAVALLPSAAGASLPDPGVAGSLAGPTEPASDPLAPTADDGGAWEIGAEAAGGNLSAYACSEASYLTSRLTSRGWVSRFLYCGADAWEEDFKKSSAGGTESSYLDSVDLMFYVGHGGPNGFTFDSAHDDGTVSSADCQGAWGDGDNEWVALTSCQVLSDPNRVGWANCMNRTHQILGFITNAEAHMGTSTQAYQFAYYLSNAWTVTGSWFKACDVTQAAGKRVRALGEELASYNDRVWSPQYISPDTVDNDYYWWDHTCGSPMPRPVSEAQLQAGTMPVFSTPPLSLAEARAQSGRLNNAFGISLTVPAGDGRQAECVPGSDTMLSQQINGKELEMDRCSGLFTYYDMNLWSSQTAQAALSLAQGNAPAGVMAIDQNTAKGIADQFLASNGLMPSGAQFFEVVSDTVATQGHGPNAALAVEQAPTNTVWQVIYGRVVTATVAGVGGMPDVVQEWQVGGPGAKLKVYVPVTATVADGKAPLAVTVSGAVGGWRPVATAGLRAVQQTQILTPTQIYALQADKRLEPMVTLNTPPIDAASTQVISSTIMYWEDGVSTVQSELLPVYALKIAFFNAQQQEITRDFTYIPAHQRYMRPYAKITTVPTTTVRLGNVVTLTAEDANQTLEALGFVSPTARLNFVIGSGQYIYEWYVGSVAPENRIGGGRSISYKVQGATVNKGEEMIQNIILRVTDSGDADQRMTTDTREIKVSGGLLNLPLILRQ